MMHRLAMMKAGSSFGGSRLRAVLLLPVVIVAVLFMASLEGRRGGAHGGVSGGMEMLDVYHLRPGIPHPEHNDLIHEDMLVWNGTLRLHDAHLGGRIHKGNVMWIVDSDGNILSLKRGMQMKTCPGQWSIIGEHSAAGESNEMNVERGLREELGSDILKHIRVSHNLTAGYRWYYRDYGRGRIDRQLTSAWFVLLDVPHTSVKLVVDDEVADTRWMSIGEWLDWLDQGPLAFCHESVSTLFQAIRPALIETLMRNSLCEPCDRCRAC